MPGDNKKVTPTWTNLQLNAQRSRIKGLSTVAEAYSESSQTSEMELFAEIVDGVNWLIIFSKTILDVCWDSKCASEYTE